MVIFVVVCSQLTRPSIIFVFLQEINLRRVLLGHRAAVNVVDFDNTFIVSASGDRTIKVRLRRLLIELGYGRREDKKGTVAENVIDLSIGMR